MNERRGTHPFMLESNELKRRMDALRTLRGLRQADLAELVHGDGFGLHDVGRLERGAIPLTAGIRHSLAEHLDVDERWFMDEDLTHLVKPGAGETGDTDEVDALAMILARLDEIAGRVHRLEATLEPIVDLSVLRTASDLASAAGPQEPAEDAEAWDGTDRRQPDQESGRR